MRSTSRLFLMALTIALLVMGCSDSTDPGGGGGTPDTTPPGITSVTAVDATSLTVVFSEAVLKASAERADNYTIVEVAPPKGAASPGDTTWVSTAVLDTDGMTVYLSTYGGMSSSPYQLKVTGVSDTSGNVIESAAVSSFTGSDAQDITPPTIIDRSPGHEDTGVGIGQPVVVQFSEPMNYNSVMSAFIWMDGQTPVPFEMDDADGNVFIFTATDLLDYSTVYTVTMGGQATDLAGNHVSLSSWFFTTTAVVDNTPPTLVSSTPTNNATSVAVGTSLVLNFSEAVEQNSLDDVLISPDIGDGIAAWSNGGKTIAYDPYEDMMPNTTYNLLMPPGSIKDLAGNGNESVIQITWSTGTSLAAGSFSGTITGPGTVETPNPAGAIVIAADLNPFGEDDDFNIAGSAEVPASGVYTVANLPDGTYWPACYLDTNDDEEIDPSYGDAIGAYGVTWDPMDGDPMSVEISEGSQLEDIDFAIYDPVALAGTFAYEGDAHAGCCFNFFIGVFDTTGFDFNDPGDPVVGSDAYTWPFDSEWTVTELDDGLEPGTYYIAGYLDGNQNGFFDESDPFGIIGGEFPTPITVSEGTDRLDLAVVAFDVEVPVNSSTAWTRKGAGFEGKEHLRRLVEMFKKASE